MVQHNKELQQNKIESGTVFVNSINRDISANLPQMKAAEISEDGLQKLVDKYGADKVGKMSDQEAYLAYKSVC